MAECPVCHADLGIEARLGEIDGFRYRTKYRWYQPEEQEDALFWACPGCKSLLWKTGSGPALLSILILLPQMILLGMQKWFHHGLFSRPSWAEWSGAMTWGFYALICISALIMVWCVNRMRFPLKPVPFMATSRNRIP